MKSTLKLVLLLFIIFQIPTEGQGQILRRTLNKLGERVVEKKVEKEIDKKIDQVADSIVKAMDGEEPMTEEEKMKAAENRKKAGSLLSGMIGGINQVDLPERYDFDFSIVMEMEDEKGKITHMTSFYGLDSPIMGYEMNIEEMKKGEKQFIVMDFEQEYMATFSETDGQKVAMSMPLPMDMISSMAADEIEKQQEDEEYSIKKTGNTRTINGYHCTEYVTTTEDYIQHIWLTDEVDVKPNYTQLFSSMMKNKKAIENPFDAEGYPILIEMIERKKNKKSYIRTKEIKEGKFPFQASEYSYAY